MAVHARQASVPKKHKDGRLEKPARPEKQQSATSTLAAAYGRTAIQADDPTVLTHA